MITDLSFALRTLRRQPGFALAAIATLAVGIGATTAIFSTVNAALLRPLPYPRAGDLRLLGTAMTDGRPTTGRVAPLELARLNDPALSIAAVAAATPPFDATLIGDDGNPMSITVAAVGEGFFDVFGLPMTVGRAFTHEEQAAPGNNTPPPPVAVVSYRIWRDLLGGDPNAVGKSIRLLEVTTPLPIVGVAARDFDTPHGVDLWFNLRLDMAAQGHFADGYLRMKPGTTPARLQSELSTVMGRIAQEFPVVGKFRVYEVRTLVQAIVGDLSSTLLIVWSASVLLLLLACVNVTNLLLARSAVRSREIALRVALGASRGRIIRQLLMESMVIAAAGTAAGLFIAWAGVRLLLVFGASQLPRLEAVPFDANVLLFALAALVSTGLLVGLAPALRLAATDIRGLMNDGGRSATAGRAQHRALAMMIVAEIALAIVLVTGAGWLVRSFANLQATDPGFVAEGRLAVDVLLPFAKYNSPDKALAWSQEISERVRAIGTVKAVASSQTFPLRPGRNTLGVTYLAFQEQLDDPDHPRPAHPIAVSPGFFDVMGIKMIGGRAFAEGDRRGAPAVAIVNRSFVRRYLTGRDPLTARFATGYPAIDPKSMLAIVGVVDDVKYGSLAEVTEPIFYVPQNQTPYWQQTIVVATSLKDPATLGPSVQAAIRSLDPQLLLRFSSVPRIVEASLGLQRVGLMLMMLFAVVALGLAAIGIYGVVAYASAQRVGEVATRMALGATPANIFRLMVIEGRALSMVGIVLGLVASIAAGRVVASRLYQVRAFDPVVLMSAVGLVVAIAFLAVVVPARRASRVNPAKVLRLD